MRHVRKQVPGSRPVRKRYEVCRVLTDELIDCRDVVALEIANNGRFGCAAEPCVAGLTTVPVPPVPVPLVPVPLMPVPVPVPVPEVPGPVPVPLPEPPLPPEPPPPACIGCMVVALLT